MTIRAHLVVSGEVQGVFYRASARDEASNLGLRGWIRNLSNGDVESTVEGPESSVDEFIEWCKHGPPGASVSDIRFEKSPPRDDFKAFSIIR